MSAIKSNFRLWRPIPLALVIALFVAQAEAKELIGSTHKDDCLVAPNSPAPQGSQWNFRLERKTQRKCWYMLATGKVKQKPPIRIYLAYPYPCLDREFGPSPRQAILSPRQPQKLSQLLCPLTLVPSEWKQPETPSPTRIRQSKLRPFQNRASHPSQQRRMSLRRETLLPPAVRQTLISRHQFRMHPRTR